MKKLAAPSSVAASVAVGRRRLDCTNVGEVDAAGGCYRFDSRGCGGPDCCVVDQRVPRRISDGFKKLIASAGWAYRILQANDRGWHVALDAIEVQIVSAWWYGYALATFHEIQPVCESERDSLKFIQKSFLGATEVAARRPQLGQIGKGA